MYRLLSMLLCFLAPPAPIHAQHQELQKGTVPLLVPHIPNLYVYENHARAEIELNPAPVPILNGDIVYPEYYRFHSGDDTAWAKPELDDSDWEQVRNGTWPDDQWKGIGWFRLVVYVDSTLWRIPLGLHIKNIFGAIEFYLDGRLIHRVGTIVASKEKEEARIMWDPVAITFFPSRRSKERSRHLVAVRYSSFFWDSASWSGRSSYFSWQIGDLRDMQLERARQTRRATLHQMLLMGVFLAFTLLHSLLYLFFPRLRLNLYFAAVTLGSAMLVFFQFEELFIINASHFFWNQRLLFVSGTIVILSLLRFTHALIYPKPPKIFYAFLGVGVLITVGLLLRPFLIERYQIIFYVLGLAEIGRALAATWIKKRKLLFEGSWIILIGTIPLLLVGSYYFLATDPLGLVPLPWRLYDFPTPYYAVLIVLISMSIFLGRNFAQTNKDLEAKLVEVKELSEKTLQQAREQSRLEAENARKTQELEEARRLQLSMLPTTVPRLPNLEIAVYSKPATEVGGDYYDFHLDDARTLTIAIGDATGHGMSAGTLVSVVKGLFQSLAPQPSIPQTLKEISATLARMNLGSLFMAMTLAKYRDNTIRISAAGMPPALHYKAQQEKVDEILLKGLPLGGFPDFVYQERAIDLKAGDALIFMSDGLPERFNDAGEILDYPGARRLAEEIAHRSPQDIIDYLVSAGEEWSNGRPQDDDVTFVVIKRFGDSA